MRKEILESMPCPLFQGLMAARAELEFLSDSESKALPFAQRTEQGKWLHRVLFQRDTWLWANVFSLYIYHWHLKIPPALTKVVIAVSKYIRLLFPWDLSSSAHKITWFEIVAKGRSGSQRKGHFFLVHQLSIFHNEIQHVKHHWKLILLFIQ